MLPNPIPQVKPSKLVDECLASRWAGAVGARGLMAQVRNRLIRRAVEERVGWGVARCCRRLRIRVSARRSRFLMVSMRLLVAMVLRVAVAPPVAPQADVALQMVAALRGTGGKEIGVK